MSDDQEGGSDQGSYDDTPSPQIYSPADQEPNQSVDPGYTPLPPDSPPEEMPSDWTGPSTLDPNMKSDPDEGYEVTPNGEHCFQGALDMATHGVSGGVQAAYHAAAGFDEEAQGNLDEAADHYASATEHYWSVVTHGTSEFAEAAVGPDPHEALKEQFRSSMHPWSEDYGVSHEDDPQQPAPGEPGAGTSDDPDAGT